MGSSVGPTAYGAGLREGSHKCSAAELGVRTWGLDLGNRDEENICWQPTWFPVSGVLWVIRGCLLWAC